MIAKDIIRLAITSLGAMETVKVGMIGAGSMATAVHYPSLAEFEDVDIVAACYLDRGRLDETARKYGIEKRYADYREMVEQNHLDAAFIIMPPHQLFDVVIHCLKRGLNVFIEKPPGASLEQTRNMTLVAGGNGCVTMRIVCRPAFSNAAFPLRSIPSVSAICASYRARSNFTKAVRARTFGPCCCATADGTPSSARAAAINVDSVFIQDSGSALNNQDSAWRLDV